MKATSPLILLSGIALMFVACGSKHAASPNEPLAASKGREAALEIVKMPRGSMQQERALLHMRAMEYRIKQEGDTLAAAAYIRAAEAVLDSAGIIQKLKDD